MRNPLAWFSPPSEGSANLGLFLARVPLGAWLLLSGFSRFAGKSGGVEVFVRKSLAVMPAWMPAAAGRPYLLAVPYAEIVLGAALILGIGGGPAGGLAAPPPGCPGAPPPAGAAAPRAPRFRAGAPRRAPPPA